MSLKQILVKNATTMSLHERFTKIRKTKEASTSSERIMQQLASSRNRRLAQQMERRPSVAAALRKDSIKTRLGVPGAISVRDRLKLPRAFGARRGRGSFAGKSPLIRGLNRGQGTPMETDSDTSRIPGRRARNPWHVNSGNPRRSRSRSRSRSRQPIRTVRTARSRSRSRARSDSTTRFRTRSNSRSSRYGSSLSLRGQFSGRRTNYRRGRGDGGTRVGRSDLKSYRPALTGYNSTGFRKRGGFRGRGRGRGGGGPQFGSGRGRGRGRGGGRGNFRGVRGGREPPLTKEQLDRELDQYMSTTKASLDKELDTMMSEETWD